MQTHHIRHTQLIQQIIVKNPDLKTVVVCGVKNEFNKQNRSNKLVLDHQFNLSNFSGQTYKHKRRANHPHNASIQIPNFPSPHPSQLPGPQSLRRPAQPIRQFNLRRCPQRRPIPAILHNLSFPVLNFSSRSQTCRDA